MILDSFKHWTAKHHCDSNIIVASLLLTDAENRMDLQTWACCRTTCLHEVKSASCRGKSSFLVFDSKVMCLDPFWHLLAREQAWHVPYTQKNVQLRGEDSLLKQMFSGSEIFPWKARWKIRQYIIRITHAILLQWEAAQVQIIARKTGTEMLPGA